MKLIHGKKITAIAITCIFYLSTCVSAAPNCYTVKIPEEYGKVTQRYKAPTTQKANPDDRLIIHVQDAHASFDAQKNIANIIDLLSAEANNEELDLENYSPAPVIGIEGATGTVDLTPFRAFPLKEIRKQTGEQYVKTGYLTGAELAAIQSQNNIPLWGLENPSLFKENFKSFYNVSLEQQSLEEEITQLEGYLDTLRTRIFNDDLTNFDTKARMYEKDPGQFMHFIGILYQSLDRLHMDVMNYISLFQFQEVFVLEKTINFNSLDDEITALAEMLDNLYADTHDPLRAQIQKTYQDYRQKKISQKSIANYLFAHATKDHVRTRELSHLTKAITYWRKYGNVDIGQLMQEMLDASEAIRLHLAQTENERLLIETGETVMKLKQLVALKATRKAVAYFREHHDNFNLDNIRQNIKRLALRAEIDLDVGSSSVNTAETMRLVGNFYSAAEQRDAALVDNLLRRMDEQENATGVLIAGGYHSDGVVAQLKQKGISYVTVTPAINELSDTVAYMDRMMGNVAPLSPHLTSFLPVTKINMILQQQISQATLQAIIAQFNDKSEEEAIRKAFADAGENITVQLVLNTLNNAEYSEFARELHATIQNRINKQAENIAHELANTNITAASVDAEIANKITANIFLSDLFETIVPEEPAASVADDRADTLAFQEYHILSFVDEVLAEVENTVANAAHPSVRGLNNVRNDIQEIFKGTKKLGHPSLQAIDQVELSYFVEKSFEQIKENELIDSTARDAAKETVPVLNAIVTILTRCSGVTAVANNETLKSKITGLLDDFLLLRDVTLQEEVVHGFYSHFTHDMKTKIAAHLENSLAKKGHSAIYQKFLYDYALQFNRHLPKQIREKIVIANDLLHAIEVKDFTAAKIKYANNARVMSFIESNEQKAKTIKFKDEVILTLKNLQKRAIDAWWQSLQTDTSRLAEVKHIVIEELIAKSIVRNLHAENLDESFVGDINTFLNTVTLAKKSLYSHLYGKPEIEFEIIEEEENNPISSKEQEGYDFFDTVLTHEQRVGIFGAFRGLNRRQIVMRGNSATFASIPQHQRGKHNANGLLNQIMKHFLYDYFTELIEDEQLLTQWEKMTSDGAKLHAAAKLWEQITTHQGGIQERCLRAFYVKWITDTYKGNLEKHTFLKPEIEALFTRISRFRTRMEDVESLADIAERFTTRQITPDEYKKLTLFIRWITQASLNIQEHLHYNPNALAVHVATYLGLGHTQHVKSTILSTIDRINQAIGLDFIYNEIMWHKLKGNMLSVSVELARGIRVKRLELSKIVEGNMQNARRFLEQKARISTTEAAQIINTFDIMTKKHGINYVMNPGNQKIKPKFCFLDLLIQIGSGDIHSSVAVTEVLKVEDIRKKLKMPGVIRTAKTAASFMGTGAVRSDGKEVQSILEAVDVANAATALKTDVATLIEQLLPNNSHTLAAEIESIVTIQNESFTIVTNNTIASYAKIDTNTRQIALNVTSINNALSRATNANEQQELLGFFLGHELAEYLVANATSDMTFSDELMGETAKDTVSEMIAQEMYANYGELYTSMDFDDFVPVGDTVIRNEHTVKIDGVIRKHFPQITQSSATRDTFMAAYTAFRDAMSIKTATNTAAEKALEVLNAADINVSVQALESTFADLAIALDEETPFSKFQAAAKNVLAALRGGNRSEADRLVRFNKKAVEALGEKTLNIYVSPLCQESPTYQVFIENMLNVAEQLGVKINTKESKENAFFALGLRDEQNEFTGKTNYYLFSTNTDAFVTDLTIFPSVMLSVVNAFVEGQGETVLNLEALGLYNPDGTLKDFSSIKDTVDPAIRDAIKKNVVAAFA